MYFLVVFEIKYGLVNSFIVYDVLQIKIIFIALTILTIFFILFLHKSLQQFKLSTCSMANFIQINGEFIILHT